MSGRTYLSIGDVLSLLREEFPDITISKIRFLESQGLVDPERSASGYRKFYDHDVERLRWVLRQQREHFLPLKVIRDRLAGVAKGAPAEDPPGTVAADGRAADSRAAATDGAAVSEEVVASEEAVTFEEAGPAVGAAPTGQAAVADQVAAADKRAVSGLPVHASVGNGLSPTRAEATVPAAVAGSTGTVSSSVPPMPSVPPSPSAEPAALPSLGVPSAAAQSRASAPMAAAADDAGAQRAGDGPTASSAPRRGEPKDEGGPARGPSPAPSAPASPVPAPASSAPPAPAVSPTPPAPAPTQPAPADVLSSSVSGVSLTLDELCRATGLSTDQVALLESFGLVQPMSAAGVAYYDEEALTVAQTAAELGRYGIEPRHLRLYRNAVDREAGLIEQVITPLLRQRNPEARQRAVSSAADLARLGERLRSSLVRRELRRQLGS